MYFVSFVASSERDCCQDILEMNGFSGHWRTHCLLKSSIVKDWPRSRRAAIVCLISSQRYRCKTLVVQHLQSEYRRLCDADQGRDNAQPPMWFLVLSNSLCESLCSMRYFSRA